MEELPWHPRSAPVDRIMELRRAGVEKKEIAKIVDRSPETVKAILRYTGLSQLERDDEKRRRERDRKHVARLDAQGASAREIARQLGGRSDFYVRRLKQETRRKKSGSSREPISERDREIVRLYTVVGLSQRKIAKKLGISQPCVNHTLRGLGYTGKDRGGYSPPSPSDEDLRHLYLEKRLGIKAISKATGAPTSTLRERLLRMGVTLRKPKGAPGQGKREQTEVDGAA